MRKPKKPPLYIPTRSRDAIEKESARVALCLNELPYKWLKVLNARQIIKLFDLRVSHSTVWAARKAILKEREAHMKAGTTSKQNPQRLDSKQTHKTDDAQTAQQLVLERIARIITKSYPHLGDDERIGTEDALRMIYRELGHFDQALLIRNEKRALPLQRPFVFNPQADINNNDRRNR